MNNSGFRSRALAMLLLWLLPAFAHADETALGPVKPEAMEFKPDRLFDPTVLLPIEVGGVWGYVDRRGNIVVAPQYDWVDYFYGPFTGAKSMDTWFARYMSQGRMGWLVFYENRKRGKRLIQGNDLRVIKAGGDTGDRFSDGHTVRQHVSDSGRSYYLSKPDGKRLNKMHYTGALRMSDGYSAVQIDGLCGFIDKRGKLVVPLEYAWVRSFREGVSAVRQSEENGGAWGFIDKRGAFKFLAKADEMQDLRSYHDGLVAVNIKGKWGFLDRRQRPRTAPIYDEVRDFVGGCAAVRRGTEWGYINVNGEEVAWGFDGAWQFDDAVGSGLTDNNKNSLEAPLGLIRQGGGYGYVSRTGRIEIEPRFESALPFFRGVARVKCGESFAYITPNGRPIWDPRRVTRFGIRGIQSPPPVKPKWPGLPRSSGANRTGGAGGIGGEPFPFEYDVPDYLPLDLDPTEKDDKHKENTSAESTADSQPDANEGQDEKETSEAATADEKPEKRIRYVR